jgi:hypothetical protein
MGWASGSSILLDVWSTVRGFVPEKKRVEVLTRLMTVFANHDCDTLNEVIRSDWPESEPAYEKWMAGR